MKGGFDIKSQISNQISNLKSQISNRLTSADPICVTRLELGQIKNQKSQIKNQKSKISNLQSKI